MSKNSEQLNAYLDGELDVAEMTQLEQQLQQDTELRAHLRQLQDTRRLYRQAFAADTTRSQPQRTTRPRLAIAASLLLALGGLLGWKMHGSFSPPDLSPTPHGVVSLDSALTSNVNESARIIMHIGSNKDADLQNTVESAEYLLADYMVSNKPLRLEIIANADGLDLLRNDKSPMKERLLELQKHYPNLALLACGKTIARLKRENGIDAPLLPGVIVVPSALDQIIHRLREDWAYIRT